MNAIAPAFGCTGGGLPFEEALARVLALAEAPLPAETVPLAACAGRVLASPVVARLDLPGFDQSAMDGYAVCAAGVTPGAPVPVTGRTAAGESPACLGPGAAHRIFTGAPVPAGADAVIAQEHADRAGDVVTFAAAPPAGTNLRRRGEDMRAGDRLIAEGTSLDWRHIAVLAAQGIGAVPVRRRPRVALISSGRELCGAGAGLLPGRIHDSNLPMLTALLTGWGADVHPLPPVPDDVATMRRVLREAAGAADLVLTTAGISVGEEDHVRAALADPGACSGGGLAVLKVAMKPGKPLAAGRLGGAAFIGLPGNPQAALAGAVGFVRPLLARLAGTPAPRALRAMAGFALRRRPGRAEFLPVRLEQHGACLRAQRAGPGGSGRLAPLLAATGLAFLPADAGDVAAGDLLAVLPCLAGGSVTAAPGLY